MKSVKGIFSIVSPLLLVACSSQDMVHEDSAYYAPASPQTKILPAESLAGEKYAKINESQPMLVSQQPVSTFSIDVDTGSYSRSRRMLMDGHLPTPDMIRVEEFINYFDYTYPSERLFKVTENNIQPTPFSTVMQVAPTPWNEQTQLLRIGIKGAEVNPADIPGANLVFLVDVSGSMRGDDRLGLVKKSLKALIKRLDHNDRIALVVYAGAAGVVLRPTQATETDIILNALDDLEAGGSTNGGSGIQLAYNLAQHHFIEGGINRVILCTDGDLNVGVTRTDDLVQLIEDKRKLGIGLTTLGFGIGNYNDHLLEQLANKGNGNYAYIDSYKEALKVLDKELTSTLLTIAKDVKVQLEFNPALVAEYRLVGYENRALARTYFDNDQVDAGEIGAGHTVTALYEFRWNNRAYHRSSGLRYGEQTLPNPFSNEIAYLKLRYKHPESSRSRLLEFIVTHDHVVNRVEDMDENFKFAASVAAFAQKLRRSRHVSMSFDEIQRLSKQSLGRDIYGNRAELLGLLDVASSLYPDK